MPEALNFPNNPDDSDDNLVLIRAESCPSIPGRVEDSADGAIPLPPADVSIIDEIGFKFTHWLVQRLGDRWTFPILVVLRRSPMRFAKLKRALGPVSQRMLTFSLKKLERDGLIHREERPGVPPQVSYRLTALGVSLVDRLATFNSWLEDHRSTILAAHLRYSPRQGESGRG
jgi:DNA-binding HxlR family transcriptional regulator